MSQHNQHSDEFQKLSEIISKNRRSTSIITIVSILAAIIGFGSMLYRKHIVDLKKEEIQVKKDSVETLLKDEVHLLDSLYQDDSSPIVKSRRKNSAKQIIEHYLQETNDSVLLYYYADTLEQYFKQKNFPRSGIAERKRLRGRHADLDYLSEDIILTYKDDNTIDVRFDALYSSNPKKFDYWDVEYNIKLDTNNKIYYINSWKKGAQYEADK